MAGSYKIIKLPDFARALEGNLDVDHLLMLGAGASVSSGVQTAKDCIWEWKGNIYLSNNPTEAGTLECQSEEGRRRVQEWIDGREEYPSDGADEEYEYYAENAFINNELRRSYFEALVKDVKPGVGYKVLALLAEHGVIRMVLTTNFDGLAFKAMNDHGLHPRPVTIETSELIHMPMRRKACFYIALHGDYKYGKLKNTGEELDTQIEDFKVALRIHLYNKHLIVMGYSGRDKSLMSAIEDAYLKEDKGRGILFWCSYSESIQKEVDVLLKKVSARGREAVLVVAGDFDESLSTLGAYCFSKHPEMLTKLRSIVGFAGVNAGGILLDEVQLVSMPAAVHVPRIDVDIERLNSAALNAAARAVLYGAWTDEGEDQSAIGEAIDESQ